MTDNSDCCNNGQGNWYDVTGGEIQQEPDGDSDMYVARGDGVVYLNCRRGGQSGIIMLYSKASTSTLGQGQQVWCHC